jgi:hypothetical protein
MKIAMKPKNPLRSVLIVLLVVTSICSYIYLNTYASIQAAVLEDMKEAPIEMEKAEDDKKVALPEVKVVHKVLRGISRLVPATY